MAEYNREEDIQKVLASNPGMTRAEAEKQVDRNSAINQSFTSSISKSAFNTKLVSLANKAKPDSLKTAAANAKTARAATEGSTIGLSLNSIAGGFKSLTVTTSEGDTVTIEPTVAILDNSINNAGITVTKTSTKSADITTLTGKAAGNGFLKTVITQGSPKGIENAVKSSVTTDKTVIKNLVAQASNNPEVASESVGTDVSKNVLTEVKTATAKANKELANPFSSLNKSISDAKTNIAGAAGNPFANVLGNVAAVVSGALTPSNFSNISTKALNTVSKLELNPKTGVEEPLELIKSNGSTNLNNALNKSNYTSADIAPAVKPVKLGSSAGWAEGATSKNSYSTLFTYVNTVEELETEFKAAFKDRPVTAMLVKSTKSATDADFGAELMQDVYAKKDQIGLIEHLIIRRDGSIQRGRPLTIEPPLAPSFKGWEKRTIIVNFIGGIDLDKVQYDQIIKNAEGSTKQELRKRYVSSSSFNTKQWDAFEKICKAFKKVVPGGEAISWDEGSAPWGSPFVGFSAIEWTNTRFGWETLYVGDNSIEKRGENGLGPFQVDEISKYVPAKVAKATASPSDTAPASAEIPESEKTEDQKLADEKKLITTQAAIDKNASTISTLNAERQTLLGDRDSNKQKIKEIDLKIASLTAANDLLETTANSLKTDVYPLNVKKESLLNAQKQFAEIGNSAKSLVDAAADQLADATRDTLKSIRR